MPATLHQEWSPFSLLFTFGRQAHEYNSASVSIMSRVSKALPSSTSVLILVATLGLLLASLACSSATAPILFVSDRDGNLEIYSVNPYEGGQMNLTNSPGNEMAPVLSPNRKLVAFSVKAETNTSLEVMHIDGSSRIRITPDSGTYRSQIWAPNGNLIAYISDRPVGPEVYVANVDGSEHVRLTSIPGDEIGDWSRDGKTVMFAVRAGQAQGIYSRNPEGVNELRITNTPDYGPVWSPNSKRIAFLSTRDGNPEVYIMGSDGGNQTRLTETDALEYDLSWSPDGRQLLWVSERDGNPEIYVSNLDGTAQTRLTHNVARDDQPVWSPNGKKIAFVSYLDGDAEIFIMDEDGDNQIRLTSNNAEDSSPSW